MMISCFFLVSIRYRTLSHEVISVIFRLCSVCVGSFPVSLVARCLCAPHRGDRTRDRSSDLK